MNKNLRLTTLLVSTTTLSMAFTPAAGQETPGGLTLTYGISSTLRANDNIGLDTPSPGDSFLWDNRLSFGLLKETQTDTLELDLSGILRLSDTPATSDGFDFDDQRVRFGYDREGANSRLGFGARYRRSDLSFTDPVRLILDDLNNDGVIDDQDFLVDDGTLNNTDLDFEFETGTNSAFGAGIELSYDFRRYEDTTDPGLFDEDIFTAEVFGRFDISPVAEGRIVLGYEFFDQDDVTQEERETYETRFELDYALNPVTTLEAMIGYRDIEETTIIPTVITESGIIAGLGLTRDLANGSAGVDLETDLTVTGRRSTLIFNRSLDLPTGELDVAIGAAYSDSSDETDVVGSLSYTHNLPRGSITATLEREALTDEDGDDRVTTLAGLELFNQINPVSSLLFEFDYVMNDTTIGGGAVDNDTDAATFRATYIRELTRDWNLRTGYEYRSLDRTVDGFRDSNEIFVTLEREFTIRR
ncbi:MAG: hypothetical protein AAF066_04005 [Pseudomonadota bacterium]